jgi:hypothetical protein
VLCRDMLSGHILEEYGIKTSKIPSIMEEAKYLCTPDSPVVPRAQLTARPSHV